MIWSLFPVIVIDILGSLAAVVLTFLSFGGARRLWRTDTDNAFYIFLLWLSGALALFALSRSLGHILQHLLQGSGYPHWWRGLAPFSGSFNTVTFIVIASVTAFFAQFQRIYRRMRAATGKL